MRNIRQHGDYTIGWICALDKEMEAARAMLESEHEKLPQDFADANCYVLGDIGPHNIVIACLPWNTYGMSTAANVATHMARSFENIRMRFMVGIGGGIPLDGIDLRLGDVVVGKQVIQSDFGKARQGGTIERTGVAISPQREIAAAIPLLLPLHQSGQSNIPNIIRSVLNVRLTTKDYAHPGASSDQLYRSGYAHVSKTPDCAGCDAAMLVERDSRHNNDPKIHYEIIASGSLVIKDSIKRDELGRDLKAACVEMEAAGLTGHFPCLVVRGICDYADDHKNDQWQGYAALVAAAYVKDLLLAFPSTKARSPAAVDERPSLSRTGTLTSSSDNSCHY